MKTYFGLHFGAGKIHVVDQSLNVAPEYPNVLHDSGFTTAGRLRITSTDQQLAFTLDHQGEKQIACLDHHQLTIAGGLDNPLFERGVGPVIAQLTLPHVVCLHTAAILVNGRSILFLGESGTGKSSSAYALSAEPQMDFACDDVAVIDVTQNTLLLGPRRAWLRESGTEKTRIDFEDSIHKAPIDAIILLRRQTEFSWHVVPQSQAVIDILLSSFRLTHPDPALKERVSRDLVQLARSIPVYHFGFPTSPSGRPEHLLVLRKRLLEIA